MADKFVIAVDVETTGYGHVGTPPREDAVIQIGLAYHEPDEGSIRSWSKLCNPGERYFRAGRADDALEISGFTVDQVLDAPPVKQVAAEFWEEVEAAERARDALAEFRAFNVEFDAPFLAKTPWEVPDRRWGPCIMKRAAVALNGPNGKWPKLEEAVRRFGLDGDWEELHDAGVDTKAALGVDEVLDF